MLLKALESYLSGVEAAVHRVDGVYIERYEEEILTSNRITLRIRLRFPDGALLELNEAVLQTSEKLQHLCYRYHFQDRQNQLIFRYDNTPHFPALKNFPHHKHLPDEVIGCDQPDIIRVISEADAMLSFGL